MRSPCFVRAITILALLSGCSVVNAQTAPAQKNQDPLSRDTPQSSVFSFLEACHANDFEKAWRYLDLRGLAEDKRSQEGPQLAQQLEQVLDRDPRFDVASLSREKDGDLSDGLPQNSELVDTFTVGGRPEQLTLQRTTLRSGLQVWLFAPNAVTLIPKLAALSTGSPIDKYLPPQLVNWKLMDTSLWRCIAMVLLAALLALFSRWISRLALFIANSLLGRRRLEVDARIHGSLVGPLQLLLPVAVFRAAFPALGLSALLRLALQHVCEFLFVTGIAWLCFRLIDSFLLWLRGFLAARKRQFPHSAVSLASRILKLAVLVFALTTLLGDWGYKTSTILAGLGVGGIAVALAAQKTIENLFGGLAVISDRPVRVGDYCSFGGSSGTVEDIGLRSTRIRTAGRTLVTVPNGSFSAMTLENFNRRDKMLFHITLNLQRDTTPKQVRTILESIGGLLARDPKIEQGAIPVRFVGIGAYSLDLEVFVYVLTLDGDEFLKIQQELLLTILDEVAAAGAALALPTQASVTYSPISHSAMERQPVPEQREPDSSVNGRR